LLPLIGRDWIPSISMAGVLTVRYKTSGEVSLDCTNADASKLTSLLQALQTQRDRNRELDRRRKQKASASI
jgi:hypothetical protein